MLFVPIFKHVEILNCTTLSYTKLWQARRLGEFWTNWSILYFFCPRHTTVSFFQIFMADMEQPLQFLPATATQTAAIAMSNVLQSSKEKLTRLSHQGLQFTRDNIHWTQTGSAQLVSFSYRYDCVISEHSSPTKLETRNSSNLPNRSKLVDPKAATQIHVDCRAALER